MRYPLTLAIALTGGLAGPTVHAQDDPTPPLREGAYDHKKMGKDVASHVRVDHPVCAASLLDHAIVDANGEEKGKIQELILDPQGGRILFALAACEEHEDSLYAVPVRLLRIQTEVQDEDESDDTARRGAAKSDDASYDEDVELIVRWSPTDAELASLPSIAKDDWDEATSLTFANDVRTHYRGRGGLGGLDTGRDTPRAVGGTEREEMLPTRVVRLSEVLDSDLKDLNGEDAGTLKSLFIDPSSGDVQFALVETEGGLFGGGDDVGVPLQVIEHQDATADREAVCRLTVSKEVVENAPKLEDGTSLAKTGGFADRVHRHFGVSRSKSDMSGKTGESGKSGKKHDPYDKDHDDGGR